MTKGVEFVRGKDAAGSFVVLGKDMVASTGDDETVGGADTFVRRWWIALSMGVALIKLS